MLTTRILRASVCIALAAGPLCGASASAQTAPGEESLLGRPVAAVRVTEAAGRVLAENPAELAVQPGRALQRDDLRSSLRRLCASGRYADITATAQPTPAGMHVDFLVRLNTFVGDVRFEGLVEPPSGAQAVGALRLGLGETFRQAELDRGLARAEQILRANGFYHAAFHPELHPRPGSQSVDLVIRVESGSRARLGAIRVSNPNSYRGDELARASRLKPRQPLTAARLDKGGQRVRDWLFRRGFYAARVAARPGDYDAAENTVPIHLDVSAGSPVKLEVTGVKLSASRLKQLVPIFQEASVNEDLLAEGRRNIRDYFERRGYTDCDVQYTSSENPGAGALLISYAVTLGARRRLAAVEFTGNKYFNDELLRGRLTIHPAEFLRPAVFSRRLLQQNEDSLRTLYAANGFAAAKFQTESVENYQGHADELLGASISKKANRRASSRSKSRAIPQSPLRRCSPWPVPPPASPIPTPTSPRIAATSFLYRYTFRRVVASDLQIAPEEVPLFSQPTRVSGPGVAWIRDLRDNPADPSRGRF